MLALVACGSGEGGIASQPALSETCDSTSILENGACRTFAIRVAERAPTPFTENGQAVSLEVVLFKPLAGSRFPTLVFHHGSTGDGSDPSLFGDTFTSKAIASHFVERGWMVAFPQRRGRGLSDGLYDEGFNPDRSGYSCAQSLALDGAERALQDLDVLTDWLRNRADVDAATMLVGGTSRGGILSLVHVARRPDVYRGAINFVGGWLGEGCGDYRMVNDSLFVAGASFPGRSLWLYANDDSFYSVSYSQQLFEAFSAAGGVGEFHVFSRAPGLNGHFLVNDPFLWGAAIQTYVGQL